VKPTTNTDDRKKGGRPRKYAEPSQPVTVTLPHSTLRQLQQIDEDRGRAIVKLARAASSQQKPLVEIVEFAENTGLVVVGPNQALERIPFVRMVEVAPARYLISLAPNHGFHRLEIALTDLLEDSDDLADTDHEMVSQLLEHFKSFRKSESVSMAQILLVQMSPTR
jgi:hypothetical protein